MDRSPQSTNPLSVAKNLLTDSVCLPSERTTAPLPPPIPPPPCLSRSFISSSRSKSFHIFICCRLGSWFSFTIFCFSRKPFPRFSCSWILREYCSLWSRNGTLQKMFGASWAVSIRVFLKLGDFQELAKPQNIYRKQFSYHCAHFERKQQCVFFHFCQSEPSIGHGCCFFVFFFVFCFWGGATFLHVHFCFFLCPMCKQQVSLWTFFLTVHLFLHTSSPKSSSLLLWVGRHVGLHFVLDALVLDVQDVHHALQVMVARLLCAALLSQPPHLLQRNNNN